MKNTEFGLYCFGGAGVLKDEHPSKAPVSPSNAVSISSSGILSMGEDVKPLSFQGEDDTSFWVDEIKTSLWLDGTRRHFCEPDYIEVDAEDSETPTIMILPFKAAWTIDAGALHSLCKRFDVDMKIQAFEMGMQFSQIIEIVNGEILKDQEVKYDDWDWDCPCPRTGG